MGNTGIMCLSDESTRVIVCGQHEMTLFKLIPTHFAGINNIYTRRFSFIASNISFRLSHPTFLSVYLIQHFFPFISFNISFRLSHPTFLSIYLIQHFFPFMSSNISFRLYHPTFLSVYIIQHFFPFISSNISFHILLFLLDMRPWVHLISICVYVCISLYVSVSRIYVCIWI